MIDRSKQVVEFVIELRGRESRGQSTKFGWLISFFVYVEIGLSCPSWLIFFCFELLIALAAFDLTIERLTDVFEKRILSTLDQSVAFNCDVFKCWTIFCFSEHFHFNEFLRDTCNTVIREKSRLILFFLLLNLNKFEIGWISKFILISYILL